MSSSSGLNRVRKEVLEAREQTYFYPRGKGELKFNDNTSPFGPSPSVRGLMEESVVDIIGGLGEAGYYPDQNSSGIRHAVAEVEHVDPEGVVVGAGADEILDMLFRVFVNSGDLVTVPVPTYFMYPHLASLNSARVATPYLGRPPGILPAADPASRMYIISNPHNPTGTLFPSSQISQLIESFKGIVVIDEAYAEYAGETAAPLLGQFDNLVIVRTLSKIHGLPNFRVGYSISSPELALQLRKIKNPFNVTTVSQALAAAALRDREYVAKIRDVVGRERGRVSEALASLGFHVFEGNANFLLMDAGERCDEIFSSLEQRGVFMKRVTEPGYEDCIRLTIRSPEENTEMLSRLGAVVAGLH